MIYRLRALEIEPEWFNEVLKSQKLMFDNGYKTINIGFDEPYYFDYFYESLEQIDSNYQVKVIEPNGDEIHFRLFHDELSEYVSLANQYGKLNHIHQKDNFWFKRLKNEISNAFYSNLYTDYNCTWYCEIHNRRKHPMEFVFCINEEFYNFFGALNTVIDIKNFLDRDIKQIKLYLKSKGLVGKPQAQRKAA